MTEAIIAPKAVMPGGRKDYIVATVVAVVLTAFSYGLALMAGWITELNGFEVVAVFTSYYATYLTARQRRVSYLWGVVSSISYAILFYQFDLIASSFVNVYLIFVCLYGYFRWRSDEKSIPVKRVTAKMWPVYVGISAILYLIAILAINAFNGVFGGWDAAILALTILSQLLTDNKKQEAWIAWIVLNTIAIVLYFSTGLYLVGVQYIFFWAWAFYGYYSWNQSRKARELHTTVN
jgi:nicotinamide mononucleotide transporter